MKLVGIDYLSIESKMDPKQLTHIVLLRERVIILESLDLRSVSGGVYELFWCPLKIIGAEASPVRAWMKKSEF